MDRPPHKPRPPLPPGPYLVIGLARSGAAAARALAARDQRVIGSDAGRPPQAEGLGQVGVEVHLDDQGTELLEGVGCLIKSPGVPAGAPAIAGARAAGIPVLGELELAWRLLEGRFVAVTGTNGKTTVTEWLGHVWRTAGQPVEVAGNVGTPLASLAAEPGVEPGQGTTIVCECSSFQLEDSEAFAPEVAVLLNISPDHLDRHPSFADYLEAKLRIFARQGPGNVAVWDRDEQALADLPIPGEASPAAYGIAGCDAELAPCAVRVRDGALETAGGPLIELADLALAGEHNVRNAMAVAAAALAGGIPPAAVAAGLRDFAGVPHRLEHVAERDGVRFVNDSKATNVAAAVAALRSFGGGVHAILGGSLKGADFAELAPAVAERCRASYLIGEAAPRLREELAASGVPLRDCGDLEVAVRAAAAAAEPGEVVLLAPACASFDAFRDYEQRGERFRELVEELG